MNDDRPTPIPAPYTPPSPSPISFEKTQPIGPLSAEDVLEVFSHFRQNILSRIDERDERILLSIQDIGTRIVDHYARETKRGDEHARWITELRRRTHTLSTAQQAIDIRLAIIEQHLGITLPEMSLEKLESK